MKRKMINRKNRRGSVAVEFALVAPIFFIMLFASIEFARVHMIQSSVENACFEGARRGIIPGATSAICKSTAESLLDLAKVKNYTVTVTPATIDPTTDEIVVTAVVPLSAQNGFGMSGFFQDRSMSKSITLPREQK
jgi:Flp pilus assembly protein TadG